MPAEKKPKVYIVRNSDTHGRGAFATTDIRKGTKIIEYKGKVSSWKKALKRAPSDPDDPYHTMLFELDNGKVIDARINGNAARWINHSCEPNCEAEEEEDRVFIYALRKIREGEELCYDYKLTIDGKVGKKLRKAYACLCGAKKCRGTMLDLER